MTDAHSGLRTLTVWLKAMDFAVAICEHTVMRFPEEEKYALTSQLRRSAQSIPANIAEGYGRYYYQESVRFCYIARGSLDETYSHLTLAHRLGYIPSDEYRQLSEQVTEWHRLLNGYIAYLKRNKRGKNEPGSRLLRDDLAPYPLPDDPPPAP